MINKYTIPIYIALLVGILWLGSQVQSDVAQLNDPPIVQPVANVPDFGMTLPPNYRQTFELYLIIDRPDETVRHIYVHPDAVAASAAGDPLPDGTQVIIETWDARLNAVGSPVRDENGRYIADVMDPNIHMMEKRDNWTIEQLPSPVGVVDWNFGSFNAETFLPSDENRNDCLTCHDAGAFRRDFMFSERLLTAYATTGNQQYLYCNLTGRRNCIR